MKKKKVVFYEGTFIDFKGLEREYTMAAISCPIFENEEAADDEVKQLRLGIGVRHEGDEYMRGIGMVEAEKKAMEAPFAIIRVTQPGIINEESVNAILKQEAEFFEVNPGKYLKNYNKDWNDYKENLRMKEVYDSLPKEAKEVHKYLLTADEDIVDDLFDYIEYTAGQLNKEII